MKTPTRNFAAARARVGTAFTLVEVMVSTALVILIMVLLLSTVDSTQKVWSRGRAKISQFQAARNAFESMTRQLSQATLNTYYDIEYRPTTTPGGLTTNDPVNFFRQSELHFVSGKMAQKKFFGTAQDENVYPTHGVFFQTPVGYSSPYTRNKGTTSSFSNTRELTSLLTAIGYFVKWGPEEDLPYFLKDVPSRPKQYRFRLLQVQSPSEGLGLFTNYFEVDKPPEFLTTTTGWIQMAIDPKKSSDFYNVPPRVLSENIVALIILPKMPLKERPAPNILDLAPDYEYDSHPATDAGVALTKAQVSAGANQNIRRQFNQLPPIVQVTMVAIDEESAVRAQELYGDQPPPITHDLFKKISIEDDFDRDLGLAATAKNGDSLVRRLIEGIDASHAWKLNYRVYTTDVVIRGAKWSHNEGGAF